jgi:hypothetical protein
MNSETTTIQNKEKNTMTTVNEDLNVAAGEYGNPIGGIYLEAKFPVAPERVYELLINGAKFGEITGQPGK